MQRPSNTFYNLQSTSTFSMLVWILYHSLPINKFYIPWCPRSRKLEKGEERFYFLLTPGWQEPAPLNRILEQGYQRTFAKYYISRRRPLLGLKPPTRSFTVDCDLGPEHFKEGTTINSPHCQEFMV